MTNTVENMREKESIADAKERINKYIADKNLTTEIRAKKIAVEERIIASAEKFLKEIEKNA